MNNRYVILSIIPIFLLIVGQTRAQSLRQRLRSSDSQTRSNAFYELFGGAEDRRNSTIEIYGKTTKEIHELLGDPTSTFILEYNKTRWLLVQFLFESCPTEALVEEKDSCKKGWRFGPSLLFRDGISVSSQVFSDETGASRYSVTPEHLRFNKGGSFPQAHLIDELSGTQVKTLTGNRAAEQALGADSPWAGFFVKLRGRAAQAPRSMAQNSMMEHDSRPSFGDIIETVAKHPKAYLMHGSFGEALAFLDGYANGRGIGVRHRSATVFSPYQSWLAKRLSLNEGDDFWRHFILRYEDEESALKDFATLWHEFEAEYPAAGQEFSQQSQRETHSDKLSEN